MSHPLSYNFSMKMKSVTVAELQPSRSGVSPERGIHAASTWPCKQTLKRAEARAPKVIYTCLASNPRTKNSSPIGVNQTRIYGGV
jgi:hypothetical protein